MTLFCLGRTSNYLETSVDRLKGSPSQPSLKPQLKTQTLLLAIREFRTMDFTGQELPLLPLSDGGPLDFDYSTLLQGEMDNIDYFAGEDSLASTSRTNNICPPTAVSMSTSLAVLGFPPDMVLSSADRNANPRNDGGHGVVPLAPRTSPGDHGSGSGSGNGNGSSICSKQRLERRGHTKSRRGCFNCKRRRIKVLASTFSLRSVWRKHQDRQNATSGNAMALLTQIWTTVSRDTTGMRTLRQDGAKVRVPCSAAGSAPGMSM